MLFRFRNCNSLQILRPFFSLSILKLSKLNYYKVQTREPNGLIKVSHSSQLEISQLRRRHAKHYQGMQSFSD